MNAKKINADLRKVLRKHGVVPHYGVIKITNDSAGFTEFKNHLYTVTWLCEFSKSKK